MLHACGIILCIYTKDIVVKDTSYMIDIYCSGCDD